MTQKLLPQNINAEISVLGAMLLDKIALHKARNLLRKQDFYSEQNSIIFEAILQLDDNNIEPDIITLSEKLTGKVGAHIISGLISDTATSANIEHYIQIVKDKAVARDVIVLQTRTLDLAYKTDDIFGLLGKIRESSSELLQKGITNEAWDLGKESVKVLERISEKNGKPAEFPTGLMMLDRIIRIKRGDVMTIGAESSFGKSSLALNIAMNQNKKVLYCSTELSKEEIIERMISMVGKINSNKITLGNLNNIDWQSATSTIPILQKKDITIIDVSNLRQVQEGIIKYSPDMVVIDYLQQLQAQDTIGKSKAAIIGELSRQVKQIARENKVPTILLSQLSRVGEPKEPTLSRFKESGDIENNSQICVMIWWKWKSDNSVDKNISKLIVGKNFNGATGYCEVKWQPEYFKYSNLEDNNVPDYET